MFQPEFVNVMQAMLFGSTHVLFSEDLKTVLNQIFNPEPMSVAISANSSMQWISIYLHYHITVLLWLCLVLFLNIYRVCLACAVLAHLPHFVFHQTLKVSRYVLCPWLLFGFILISILSSPILLSLYKVQ